MLRKILASVLVTSLFGVCHADECDAILEQGVRNIFATTDTANFQSDLQNAFCNSNNNLRDKTHGAGLTVGFTLYNVPIQVGGNYNDSDKAQFQQQNCGSNSSNFASSGYHTLLQEIADPNIVKAWQECKAGGGFYINAEAVGNEIIYTFRFRPAGPLTSTKVSQEPSIIGATCPQPAIRNGSSITNVTQSQVCYRTGNGEVIAVINTDFNSYTFVVPAIAQPVKDPLPPPPQPPQPPPYAGPTCPPYLNHMCLEMNYAVGSAPHICQVPASAALGDACTCPELEGNPPKQIGTIQGMVCRGAGG